MQENPLVTIICLCYNHQDYVIESLNSVINQEYKNIELIIVDDCSPDNSKSVIKEWILNYPEIVFIANEINLGNTKSFNKALKIAKGNYIMDLAADDVLLPNCVTDQVNAFKNSNYKNLGIVYGNAELINENGNFDSYYFAVDSNKKVIEKRQTGNVYSSIITSGNGLFAVSSLTKKNVFDELNGYDETLAYEDLDFWIRASRIYDFDFINKILIQKRIVTNSLGTDFLKKNNTINNSTYLILKKAIQLNRSKEEDLAIQKRVHYEILHTLNIRSYSLLLKNIGLRVWLSWRKRFKKY